MSELWLLPARAGSMLALVVLVACSTTGDVGGGDVKLPTAQAGPFRELTEDEIGGLRIAPYVIDDKDDGVMGLAVLDLDGDPQTYATAGYAVDRVSGAILRFEASDGRSFPRNGEIVLEPSEAWEGSALESVAASRVMHGAHAGHIALHYAAGGMIGLATSPDGVQFTKHPDRLLRAEQFGLRGLLAAPSVVTLGSGAHAMFFELRDSDGARIYEARSAHGWAWKLASLSAVLEPGLSEFDTARVADPQAVTSVSPLGRQVTWLYYAATDHQGKRVIAAAARDEGGVFLPASTPVFGSDGILSPRMPSVVRFESFSLLFVTQLAGSTDNRSYEATAAALAPVGAVLPAPIEP